MSFIDDVAKYVKKYAPIYGVKVYSPTIAQVILESASGTSELAVNAHNYTGTKYNASVSDLGPYYKVGSEQGKDGKYSSSLMAWNNFKTFESGIHGHFRFLFERPGITRYNNLKGITDPKEYLETIKADGYATSLNYVTNLMNIIKKYNLTKYDEQPSEDKKYYRVQCAAFKNKANCEALVNKLKANGFNAIIKQYGELYKVQCGCFTVKANAEKLCKQIKDKGFECFLVYC